MLRQVKRGRTFGGDRSGAAQRDAGPLPASSSTLRRRRRSDRAFAVDLTLTSIRGDATGRCQTARFVERDSGAENRRAAIA